MVSQIKLRFIHEKFHISDMVPQAILNQPISYFVGLGLDLEEDHDDFDEFQGVAFVLDETTPIAIKHYRGHPTGTVTIYMPSEINTVDQISRLVRRVMRDLELPNKSLRWERADNPDL